MGLPRPSTGFREMALRKWPVIALNFTGRPNPTRGRFIPSNMCPPFLTSPGIDQRRVESNHTVAVLTPAPQSGCPPQGRLPHVLTKIPVDPERFDGRLECGHVPDGHEQA